MDYIKDVNEFTKNVFLIQLDTLARGYDGETIGPANEQAQALANRTLYLKEKLEEVISALNEISERQYVATINEQTGNVKISYKDVGAAKEKHSHLTSDITTTNEAGFVSLDEKTKWNAKQDTLVSGKNINTLHGNSLLGNVDVKLNYTDVNADEAGTAEELLKEHSTNEDPHPQYLTEAEADIVYLPRSDANKPNGYIKLDENGYIPSDLATLYEARYEIVNNKEERLNIVKSKNLTMALQLDENRIYYLDTDIDPSIDENWKIGRSTELASVISVFDRSGIITAENGDYNADQITETEDRVFVSPAEKDKWNKKVQLVSGETIKTINKESVLGAGDITITPESIGAAEKVHTHTADNIVTTDEKQFVSAEDKSRWDSTTAQLTAETLNEVVEAGTGISITVNEDKLKISNVSSSDISWESKEFNNVKKGDYFFYKVPDNYLDSYPIHHFYKYFKNAVYKQDQLRTYAGDLLKELIANETLYYDENGKILSNEKFSIKTDNLRDSGVYITPSIELPQPEIPLDNVRIAVDLDSSASYAEVLTKESDASSNNYTILTSRNYPKYDAWRSFSAPILTDELNRVPINTYWSGYYAWKGNTNDVYFGITLDKPIYLYGYKVQRMNAFAIGTSTLAKSWRLEGSTSRSPTVNNWVDLDIQTNVDLSYKSGDGQFKSFLLDKLKGPFVSFRIVVTDVLNSAARPCFSRLQFINARPLLLESKADNSKHYTFDANSNLLEVDSNISLKYLIGYKGFYDVSNIKFNKIEDINKFNIVSGARVGISIYTYGRKNQIRIDKNIDADKFALICINNIGKVTPQESTYNGKIALITDDNSWYVYGSGKWVKLDIPEETSSTYDRLAYYLYDNGMTVDEFNTIPNEAFIDLATNYTGEIPNISIAYSVYNQYVNEPVTPKSVTISYGNEDGLEPAYEDDVKVKFINGKAGIEILKDGSYKLLYTFIENKLKE